MSSPFYFMSLFWEYKVTRQSLKHCGPQSHPWQGWRNGSVTTSSRGLAVFMNVHPVYRSNIRLMHKTSILRCNHVWNVNAKTHITCVHTFNARGMLHPWSDRWLIFHSNAPILVFELLIQLKLVVHGVRSSGKLLVLPGIGYGDAVRPHGEERDRTCSNSETNR